MKKKLTRGIISVVRPLGRDDAEGRELFDDAIREATEKLALHPWTRGLKVTATRQANTVTLVARDERREVTARLIFGPHVASAASC